VIRTVAIGIVCLAGLGAIGTAAKKSATDVTAAFPIVSDTKADRLPTIVGQDPLTSADRVDVAYVSPVDQNEPAALESGNQTASGIVTSTTVPRHWHDPNAKRSAAVSPDRRIKIQEPKKSKNVDRAKTSVDLRPCRRPEGFAGLLRALNLSPGCDS
jgi:hypothetical protein